jgi:carbon monoxide dehydrogenase subunit G
MRSTHSFDLTARLEQVVAYLSNPRNLITANNAGPTVEQSEPPIQSGSWAVLAFDQLRMRVEYLDYEPPARIAVSTTFTGKGSGGTRAVYAYRLEPIQATGGTRLTVEVDGQGGWVPAPLSRLFQRLLWRRMQQRIEAFAAGSSA